ncbi:MAG: hypothetical protein AABW83_02745 [Nanoarchaeota archaeon]
MKIKNLILIIVLLLILSVSYNLVFASHYNNYYEYKPQSASISYNYKNYDEGIYNSKFTNYNSYISHLYKNNYYNEKIYQINTYYPYYSYEYNYNYKENSNLYSFSKKEEIISRRLSRPETYLILWSYR